VTAQLDQIAIHSIYQYLADQVIDIHPLLYIGHVARFNGWSGAAREARKKAVNQFCGLEINVQPELPRAVCDEAIQIGNSSGFPIKIFADKKIVGHVRSLWLLDALTSLSNVGHSIFTGGVVLTLAKSALPVIASAMDLLWRVCRPSPGTELSN
jgi:hypothetical protein